MSAIAISTSASAVSSSAAGSATSSSSTTFEAAAFQPYFVAGIILLFIVQYLVHAVLIQRRARARSSRPLALAMFSTGLTAFALAFLVVLIVLIAQRAQEIL